MSFSGMLSTMQGLIEIGMENAHLENLRRARDTHQQTNKDSRSLENIETAVGIHFYLIFNLIFFCSSSLVCYKCIYFMFNTNPVMA